jgi:protein involved in polysaccharide export with SLBB domain
MKSSISHWGGCSLLIACLLAGGCAAGSAGRSAAPARADSTPGQENSTDSNGNLFARVSDREIVPFDSIIIEVFEEQDLSVERHVGASGFISYPYLGLIQVAGKTGGEVAGEIERKLGENILRHPQVTVLVKEYGKRTVSVLGAGTVQQPGLIDLPGEQSWGILDAIAQAGGLTRSANRRGIFLTRGGETHQFSLDQLKGEMDPAQRILLQPGDVIEVKERFW